MTGTDKSLTLNRRQEIASKVLYLYKLIYKIFAEASKNSIREIIYFYIGRNSVL